MSRPRIQPAASYLSAALSFFLALSAAAPLSSGPPPPPPLDPWAEPKEKIVVVKLHFKGQAEVSVLSTEVVYGTAHSVVGGPPMYQASIYNRGRTLDNRFNIWDPLLVHVDKGRGRSGFRQRSEATVDVSFPYSPHLSQFALKDLRIRQVVAIADLETPILEFCRRYGEDKGCAEALARPDLSVAVTGPDAARAGEDIGALLRVVVANEGTSIAPGTIKGGTGEGYMVDVVLSKDRRVPVLTAEYSATFREDGLLRGGREANTKSLYPGERAQVPVGAVIPADTPPGDYCLGVVVDPTRVVGEWDEDNNTACKSLKITATKTKR